MSDQDPGRSIETILEERGRLLASAGRATETEEAAQLLEVAVGDERYAFEITALQEVRDGDVVTPVPGLPPPWRGLFNVRGRLYPVLDLGAFLGVQARSEQIDKPIVFVSAAGMVLGLSVDGIGALVGVTPGGVGPPLLGAGGETPGAKGTTSSLATLLDLQAVADELMRSRPGKGPKEGEE